MTYADVVLPVPLPGLFTYALPDALQSQVQAGCRVLVPFGKKDTATALVVRLHRLAPPDITIKQVIEVVDAMPIVCPKQLAFWNWMADYYLCTLGEVYKAALPGKMKKKGKSTIAAFRHGNEEQNAVNEQNTTLSTIEQQKGDLSPAQSAAFASIQEQWQQHRVCLLHGVTSSGKTEIYIQLIKEAIAQGEQVLYLLPEIVLTTQLTERLRRVFGPALGVYHSKYSDRQREDVWMRQLSETPFPLIVGVRSSIFLPFKHLGLVIVDEEHENSFKQQDPAPRYHARDAAIMLAAQAGARTLLGTATPSFESYYNARLGKYGLVTLTERFGQVQLPKVQVVDVADEYRKRLMHGPFSSTLLAAMRHALASGQQIILFQNRRGYAPTIECPACGWTPRCPHCSVALTLHKRSQHMTCHYCGFTTIIPTQCPACESPDLRQRGFGTERIEDEIATLFPSVRVARMDLDTTRSRTAYEQLLDDFQTHRTDILVGTQMVTKGLDFEHVGLVGILSADTMLSQPDFRAYERAYQLMAQVAGRAGRRQERGLVILQTRSANLPLICQVIHNDYLGMYVSQMEERRQFAYPPFVRMIVMYVKHRQASVADTLARDAYQRLYTLFGQRILGPDEPAVGRISSLYIRRVIIKFEAQLPIARAKELLIQVRDQLLADKTYNSSHIYFDVDPL